MNTTDDQLQRVTEAIDKAIVETVSEFVRYPDQFHGDTGISHYLYHRIHMHAGEVLYSSHSRKALLLQSEQYTSLLYRKTGNSDSPGKFDFAFVDDATIRPSEVVSKHAKALIAIEVGFRKPPDDAVGSVAADESASPVRPADAAKLVREIRFRGLRRGYALELYPAQDSGRAFDVFEAMRKSSEQLAELQRLNGMVFIVALAGEDGYNSTLSSFPNEWKQQREPLRAWGEVLRSTGGQFASRAQQYESACGPCNRLLQGRLRDLMDRNPRGRRINYGTKNMSLAPSYRIKVSNRNDKPERVYDVNSQVRAAMEGAGLIFQGDRLLIPQGDEDHGPWVQKLAGAIEAVIDRLATPPESEVDGEEIA